MNQNEPIFLNLYIRDTESYRKISSINYLEDVHENYAVKKLESF